MTEQGDGLQGAPKGLPGSLHVPIDFTADTIKAALADDLVELGRDVAEIGN
jgi:hypothetical protein